MEKRTVKCIICPNGCDIVVTLDGGKVMQIEGNECKRGVGYAENECIHPVRMVTSTVKAEGSVCPVAAVRTDKPIPKEKIMDCMEEIRHACVKAPFAIGDIVIEHVAGTDANIIVTRAD